MLSLDEVMQRGYVLTDRIIQCMQMPHVPQRSAEWLKLRQACITGSIADTIIGSNTFFQSYEDVMLDKAGRPTSFTGNDATRHGQKYEPVALDEYTRRTGRHVVEPRVALFSPVGLVHAQRQV